jgi:hypothetical protein
MLVELESEFLVLVPAEFLLQQVAIVDFKDQPGPAGIELERSSRNYF